MIIERTDKELILKLPLEIGIFSLEKISRYLKYTESVNNSHSDEANVNLIADESKKRWWAENKHKFIK